MSIRHLLLWLVVVGLTVPFTPSVCAVSPGQNAPKKKQAVPSARDYTNELKLLPGLEITFPIRQGLDTRRKQIGDYDFLVNVVSAGDDGYKFKWEATAPAKAAGSRTVSAADQKGAHQISLFYKNGQNYTMMGSTNIVRVSDALYEALKSGSDAPFEIDGPEGYLPPNGKQGQDDLPRRIRPIDEDWVFVWLNNAKVPVRAIKAETDVGWTYWILDNPQFPLMVAGAGPFYWEEPRFNTSVIDAQRDADEARRNAEDEARRVANDLDKNGVATSHAILFAFDSDVLTPHSKQILRSISNYLKTNPTMQLQIQGHTDSVGTMEYNMGLSRRRAASVERYLVEEGGIGKERLSSVGRGYTMPVADNKTEQGRAQNRRVVFQRL